MNQQNWKHSKQVLSSSKIYLTELEIKVTTPDEIKSNLVV